MSNTSRELIIDGDKWELQTDGTTLFNGKGGYALNVSFLVMYALAEHDARLAAEAELLELHEKVSIEEIIQLGVRPSKEPQESKLRAALKHMILVSQDQKEDVITKFHMDKVAEILAANPPDPAIDPQVVERLREAVNYAQSRHDYLIQVPTQIAETLLAHLAPQGEPTKGYATREEAIQAKIAESESPDAAAPIPAPAEPQPDARMKLHGAFNRCLGGEHATRIMFALDDYIDARKEQR